MYDYDPDTGENRGMTSAAPTTDWEAAFTYNDWGDTHVGQDNWAGSGQTPDPNYFPENKIIRWEETHETHRPDVTEPGFTGGTPQYQDNWQRLQGSPAEAAPAADNAPLSQGYAANFPMQGNYSRYSQYNAGAGPTQTAARPGSITSTNKPPYTVSLSKTVLPKGAVMPTFKGPEWDERKARARAQRLAAPGLRKLEMGVQQAMSRYYENPNVRRMVLRDTLAGYGLGMSGVLAKASQAGYAEYSQEYAREYNLANAAYARAWQELMAQASNVQTQIPIYTKQGLEDVLGGESAYTGTFNA